MRWRRYPPPAQRPPPMTEQQIEALEREVLDGPTGDELRIAAELTDAQQYERDAEQDERAERYLRQHGIIP